MVSISKAEGALHDVSPGIPGVYMRGGTSKGIFFHRRDLPPFGGRLDRVLLDVMGSPDPMQIDGLGGTYSSTSKVVVVDNDATGRNDIRYWFAQIGIDRPTVDWSGNCGNLTTAVGPFAINEGLVVPVEPITTLRLFNENTQRLIVARVPVEGGLAKESGDLTVPGVPNRGAPITTEFLDPAGSVFGRIFPTGNRTDRISLRSGDYEVSIVDVTHPTAFVRASDFGLEVRRVTPPVLNARAEFLAGCEEVRSACIDLISRTTGSALGSEIIPRLVLVGNTVRGHEPEANLWGIGLSLGKVHHALQLTCTLCLAAAIKIGGTIPNALATPSEGPQIRIGHPKGIVTVMAEVSDLGSTPGVRSVGVVRSARRIMQGTVYPRLG